MTSVDTLGFIGGILTTFSILPQLVRVLKLRSAREISFPFTAMLLVGMLIWLIYGISSRLFPVILWNAVGAAFTGVLFYAKIKYGRD